MIYVKGTYLGHEVIGKEKKANVIHLLDGFEVHDVISKKSPDFEKGEVVEIPVKLWREKLYMSES